MKYFLLIALSVAVTSAFAQQDTTVRVFEKVEVEAVYQGPESWGNFLGQNLRSDVPVKRHAPAGSYPVLVQFIVDKDGRITQVTPLTHFGFGMEEEVVRVIKNRRGGARLCKTAGRYAPTANNPSLLA